MGKKGLRDDTTCIVVDILPSEKPAASLPPPKKQGKGMLKSMFKRKTSDSSSNIEKEYAEPDVVEELFEEGSAMLSERCVSLYMWLLNHIQHGMLIFINFIFISIFLYIAD